MPIFTKGEVVQLKSGGPIMTVESIGSYGGGMSPRSAFDGAECVWFEGGQVKRDTFPNEALDRYEP